MKIRFRFLAIGIFIALIFLSWIFVRNIFVNDSSIVLNSEDFPSPDRQWIVTLEDIDNGLGFGQGMLYDEIHVRRPGEKIAGHGDAGKSVVFYANSGGLRDGKAPQIRWKDSAHILISYDPERIEGHTPGKARKELRGISIEYRIDSSK